MNNLVDFGFQIISGLLTYGFVIGYKFFKEKKKIGISGDDKQIITLGNRKATIAGYVGLGIYSAGMVATTLIKPDLLIEANIFAPAGLIFLFTQIIKKTLSVGENGFFYIDKNYLWKDIESIHWDNDIGQKNYGLKVKFKKGYTEKLYFSRHSRDKINSLLVKYYPSIQNLSQI